MAYSSQIVALPDIPELVNPNYLDILLPPPKDADGDTAMSGTPAAAAAAAAPAPSNPLMDALAESTKPSLYTYTANSAQALSSTSSDLLDAFNHLTRDTYSKEANTYLEKAWKEDAAATLRMIWNLRSIHDGKGEKEAFYRAWGWLYEKHPRTAIANLNQLVEPVCTIPKSEKALGHGYWKDLLNILVLTTRNELILEAESTYLHSGPGKKGKKKVKKAKKPSRKTATRGSASADASAPAAEKKDEKPAKEKRKKVTSDEHNARQNEGAKEKRKELNEQLHQSLILRFALPKYRALYITVARLFADALAKDLAVLEKLNALPKGEDRTPLLHELSLAGKWAPTPGGSHDRHTNIATAIATLLRLAQTPKNYPNALNDSTITKEESTRILRFFYQKFVIAPLRKATHIVEPLMAAGKWTEIKYARVPSTAMKNNTERFFQHDPEGFQKYLIDVGSGKKKISGATLFPHELIGSVYHLGSELATSGNSSKEKYAALALVKRELAGIQLKVVEGQWNTLVNRLKESGSLENSLALCDVSGSMGSVSSPVTKARPSPIHVALALSLILASITKPPFNGGFISFSEKPKFIAVDLAKPLYETIINMVSSDWGYNTDLRAVFLDLLLPLAKKNNIAKEDMVKRLFIFSDMQFDAAEPAKKKKGNGPEGAWATTYDAIQEAYEKEGYEVPQIVYWDLANAGTVEVSAERKGVAMMNGFSPAMLKVFMGEQEEEEEEEKATEEEKKVEEEEEKWEEVGEDGETKEVAEEKAEKKEDEFNPLNVLKKAIGKKSFRGLKVYD